MTIEQRLKALAVKAKELQLTLDGVYVTLAEYMELGSETPRLGRVILIEPETDDNYEPFVVSVKHQAK